MSILASFLAELLKAVLPELLSFAWEKAHEPTTVENAAPDPALRESINVFDRLLELQQYEDQ
jgi:hypothetical protein